MKKKIVMFLMAAMLLMGGCGSKNSGNVSDNPVKDTLVVSQSGQAIPEAAPEVTKAPKETAAPEVTQAPKETAAPEVTKAPKETAAPEVTKAPKETAAPEATKAPAAEKTESAASSNKADVNAEASKPSKPSQTPEPTLAPTEHKHTLVQQVVSEATCTSGKVVANVCSECGYESGTSEAGGALGHDLQRHVSGETTCRGGAYYSVSCSRCGEVTESGHEDALPCNMVGTTVQEGNCIDSTIIEYHCSNCGAYGGTEMYTTDDHDWVTGISAPYWSEEAQNFVQDETVYCSRCNRTP